MSTDLYEVLGVQRDATEDQSASIPPLTLGPPLTRPAVRKAYHKRALQTHPDRVPPEQKTTAEEEFRKVLPVPLLNVPRRVAHS
jgi:DnaJ family protein B protein 6